MKKFLKKILEKIGITITEEPTKFLINMHDGKSVSGTIDEITFESDRTIYEGETNEGVGSFLYLSK